MGIYVIIAILVGTLAFELIDLMYLEIESIIERVRDHRFNKKYYLDHIEVKTDGKVLTSVRVYKERA